MRRSLFLALALVLVAGPASAAPVAAAIGSVVGFIKAFAASSMLAGFFVRTLAAVALSRVAMMLRGKPKRPPPAGIKTEVTTSGGITPWRFPMGTYATGGQLLAPPMSYGDVGGTPRAWLVYPVVVSCVPGCELARVIVNDAHVGFDDAPGSWDARSQAAAGDLAGLFEAIWRDGSQTQAEPAMRDAFAADPDRPWQADMIGPGSVVAYLRFRYDREHFNGLPSVRFEVRGIPLYDPRLDSTIGGSGTHRWGDRSTWTWTENPVVMVWNIMRGIDVGGGHRWGGECELEDLPRSRWFAAMNECDVEDADGVAQFRAGIEVSVDDEPADVIEELLKTCLGEMVEVGGIWDIRVGPPALPVAFVTDADVLVSQEQTFDPFPGLSETINGITATWPDPESLWESRAAPPLYDPAAEADDGGRRLLADLTLAACPFGGQVQRIMHAALKDHRRFRRHRFVLGPEGALYSPFDVIAWTSARFGYTAKAFEIASVTDSITTLRQGLALREVDQGDFVFDPDALVPQPPAITGVSPPPPQPVPGWAVEPWSIDDGEATPRRPALRGTWNAAGIADARGVRIALRPAGDTGPGTPLGVYDPREGEAITTDVLPGQAYQMRARPVADRPTAWSEWKSATAPDVRIARDDLVATEAAALDRLHGWLDWMAGDVVIPDIPPIPGVPAIPDMPIITDLPYFIARGLVEIPRIATAEQMAEDAWLGVLENRIDGSFLARRGIDAGILTDPATGQVRIAGVANLEDRQSAAEVRVDGLAAQISLRATYTDVAMMVSEAVLDPSQIPIITDLEQRVTDAEITLDAQAGTIASKADTLTVSGLDLRLGTAESDIDVLQGQIVNRVTTATFNELGDRVGAAEVQLDSLDAPQIALTVQDTRRLTREIDADAIQTLDDMLSSYADRAAIREASAQAQMQLRATVDDGFAAEAQARTALAVTVDNVRADLLVNYYVKSEADSARTSALTQLQSTMEAPGGSVGLAQAAAQDAYDLADGKSDVIYQSAAPGAEYRNDKALWFDTTDGAYTPKRWDGSAWVVATDKAATDAAAAAQAAYNLAATKLDASAITAYSTTTEMGQAIANATSQLQSTMEAPGGSVGQLQADVALKADASALDAYSTTASMDSAISQATTALRTSMETSGGSVYAAQADATAALNALPTKLDASAISNYYTKSEADSATAQMDQRVAANAQYAGRAQREADADALQTLEDILASRADRIAIRNLSADATFQMRATVDDGLAAEAQARLALAATVDNVRASLSTDYYVKSDADQAAAQVAQQLKTTLESPGGSIYAAAAAADAAQGDADAAQADATAALNALPSKADASALSNYYTKSAADSATAQAVQQLQTTMETSGGSVYAAQQAAQNAYDLADGKGRVLYQSAEPDAVHRLGRNLWIDTTGGNNTPKRWSGSAWVAVTDKVATDAAADATAALNALPSKADASALSNYYTKSAADSATAQAVQQLQTTMETSGGSVYAAQADATAALNALPSKADASALNNYYTKSAADSAIASATSQLKSSMETSGGSVYAAQAAAQAASDLAGTKGRVFVQSSAPTDADRDAKNLWIDTTSGANTPKRWDGSAWTAVSDKVATDAAANATAALNALPGKADASALSNIYTKSETDSAISDLSNTLIRQTCAYVGASGAHSRLYHRTYNEAASAWRPWSMVFNQYSLVGTVSQNAGAVTGAAIERGSNANGGYTRFADGTQVCWLSVAASSSAAKTWTFPAAFSAAPVINGTAQASVLSAVCLDSAPGTTSVTFSARDKADARRADTCYLTATGRWF